MVPKMMTFWKSFFPTHFYERNICPGGIKCHHLEFIVQKNWQRFLAKKSTLEKSPFFLFHNKEM